MNPSTLKIKKLIIVIFSSETKTNILFNNEGKKINHNLIKLVRQFYQNQ